MILLTVRDITKHFGPEPVLSGVSLEVRPTEKISLVGPNGAGKTTLLRILTGREEADSGQVELHPAARIGFLEQRPQFDQTRTVWEEAADALGELRSLAEQAEGLAHEISQATDDAQRQRLGQRYDDLQHELQRRDAYHLDHKIERVLDGLGFSRTSFRQPVHQLSGGQHNRLMMAKLLLEETDLMLLDEPSNHLDIDATEWLEVFLAASHSALLVVSHDRYFLDKVTTRTCELFQGTVEIYSGNYSAYCRQKVERLEVQRRTYERQQNEIAKLQDFVRRHHYGQKHAQAEDRRRKLEKIERVDPPREIAVPPMWFPAATRTGDVALRIEGLSKAFDQPLFDDLRLDMLRGEKWGVLGPNGCGKTTLLDCIQGRQPPDQGRVILAANVKIAYFDQRLSDLDDGTEVLDAIRPDHKEFGAQQRRDVLARFGITGDMVHQRVDSLSGGERNRTALARLAAMDANFMILDEPTNHLDLWSRGALEAALCQFDGTLLFVSHDRYFLNHVADHLLIFEPGRIRVINGNYETYLHFVREGLAKEARKTLDKTGQSSTRLTSRKLSHNAAPRRKRKYPYRKVSELEAEIAEREQQVTALHAALASPEVLRDGQQVKRMKVELDEQNSSLARLYEHWEEAMELN